MKKKLKKLNNSIKHFLLISLTLLFCVCINENILGDEANTNQNKKILVSDYLPEKNLKKYLKFIESNNFFVNYPIEFFKESVEIFVDSETVIVNGKYYLKNNGILEENFFLFYPFPTNNRNKYPDEIYVHKSQNNQLENKIDFNKLENGITCNIFVSSQSVICLRIKYKQKIYSKEATLILVTARFWPKTIEYAEFKVNLPVEFKNVNLSYKIDKIKTVRDRINYYIFRENFIPDNDLTISWR